MFRKVKPEIQVTDMRIIGDTISVKYSDGYVADFEAYKQYDDWVRLGVYVLYRQDKKVFRYNGQLRRYGSTMDENVVVYCNGSSQEEAAKYWNLARSFLVKQLKRRRLDKFTKYTYQRCSTVIQSFSHELKALENSKARVSLNSN